MERLKSRHERFCRQFVEGANATLAAKVAGYSPASARNAGYRLLRHPRIAARIAEIQEELATTHCHTIDVLIGKLETVYRRAVDDHHFSAAARAVELQAKLAGIGYTGTSGRLKPIPSLSPSRGKEAGEPAKGADLPDPTGGPGKAPTADG